LIALISPGLSSSSSSDEKHCKIDTRIDGSSEIWNNEGSAGGGIRHNKAHRSAGLVKLNQSLEKVNKVIGDCVDCKSCGNTVVDEEFGLEVVVDAGGAACSGDIADADP